MTVINPWWLASVHSAISCRSPERNMHRFSKELGCIDPLFLVWMLSVSEKCLSAADSCAF